MWRWRRRPSWRQGISPGQALNQRSVFFFVKKRHDFFYIMYTEIVKECRKYLMEKSTKKNMVNPREGMTPCLPCVRGDCEGGGSLKSGVDKHISIYQKRKVAKRKRDRFFFVFVGLFVLQTIYKEACCLFFGAVQEKVVRFSVLFFCFFVFLFSVFMRGDC